MNRSTSPSQQEEHAQYDLMRALSALHLNGKYSDLIITHGQRRWACHKALVCSRSGFFDGACSHSFAETAHGITTIDLSEDPEDAVEQMITFFYQLDYLHAQPRQTASAMFRHRAYSDPRRRPQPKVVVDMTAIEDPLLAMAGFYQQKQQPESRTSTPPSPMLGKKARWSGEFAKTRPLTPPPDSKLCEVTVEEVSSSSSSDSEDSDSEDESHLVLHTQVYALAEKYDIPALKELARRKFEMAMACYYDAPEFAAAIEEVYCSTVDTDRGLRDVVLQAFRSHPQLALTQDVYAVIRETPSLTLDLFKMERGIPL